MYGKKPWHPGHFNQITLLLLLFQLEISYASIVRGTVIDNGFGDFRVRARTEVWGGDSWSVPAYAGLRAGSGSDEVFPYGTKSIDWELGLAVVDTIGSFSWWVNVTGVSVTQLPVIIEYKHGRHSSSIVVSADTRSRDRLQSQGCRHVPRGCWQALDGANSVPRFCPSVCGDQAFVPGEAMDGITHREPSGVTARNGSWRRASATTEASLRANCKTGAAVGPPPS